MRRLYAPLLDGHPCPYLATDVRTAELARHACNAFLATKISFINATARLCELAGADVDALAGALGTDPQIGRAFLDAGLGWGGPYLGKDVDALVTLAAELEYDLGLLRETAHINRETREWPLRQLRRRLWDLDGKAVAVLGLAFKPDTDDVRDAPAIGVIEALLAEGAEVRLHDPVALHHGRALFPEVRACGSAEDALRGASAVVVCTEWDEYRRPRPDRLRDLLAEPIVVDARNVWDPAGLRQAGLTSAGVGRPPTDATLV